jgi:Flp pilus assembly protein TadB
MTPLLAAAVVLGLGWTLLLAPSLLWPRPPHRLPPRAGEGHPKPLPAPPPPGPVERLGATLRRITANLVPGPVPARAHAHDHRDLWASLASAQAGIDTRASVTAPHPAPRRSGVRAEPPPRAHRAADRRTGVAALAGGALLPLSPPLAAAVVAGAVLIPVASARAARRRLHGDLDDQVPDVVDLLALTTAAGLPVSAALRAIGDRPGGPLGASLSEAASRVTLGGTTAEALDVLARAGPPVRPLVDALAQHDRYGTPLLPALDRVAIEARARRRRRAEEAARRLPVTLLFPLVLTTLPAFVLLTVVPLLAGSLGSLSL